MFPLSRTPLRPLLDKWKGLWRYVWFGFSALGLKLLYNNLWFYTNGYQYQIWKVAVVEIARDLGNGVSQMPTL